MGQAGTIGIPAFPCALRAQVARIERAALPAAGTGARLSTGEAEIDARLAGGLQRGALHEVAASGPERSTPRRRPS